jgi:hypothetical protein
MDSQEASAAISDERFINHLYHHMLGRAPTASEREQRIAQLSKLRRWRIWRSVLDSREFRLRELVIRDRNQPGDSIMRERLWIAF